jgi:hypothetical protein
MRLQNIDPETNIVFVTPVTGWVGLTLRWLCTTTMQDSNQTSPEYKSTELPLNQPAQSLILYVLTVVFWHEAKWVGKLPARHNVNSQLITRTKQIMFNIDTKSSENLVFFPYCGAGLYRVGIFPSHFSRLNFPNNSSRGYLADTEKLSWAERTCENYNDIPHMPA